jgi:hypothetical protein
MKHSLPLTRSVPSAGVTSMFNRFIAPLCYATDTASVYYYPIGDRFETLETCKSTQRQGVSNGALYKATRQYLDVAPITMFVMSGRLRNI